MKHKLIYLFLLAFTGVFAQDSLTLNNAIEMALKNNYGIQISRDNLQIADNNNTIGNAGYLPQLGVAANAGLSNTNINQRFTNGTSIIKNGVGATTYGAGLVLNYTLFSGLRAHYAYKRLGEQEALSETQLKSNINNTVANVMAAYFNVLREQQTLKYLEENLDIFEERLKIADTRFTIGSAAKTDLLQAKIDLNEQKSLIIKQRAVIRLAKNQLNQLLTRDADVEFSVQEVIPSLDSLNYDSLKNAVFKSNIDLQSLQHNINVVRYQLQEVRSTQYPTLTLGSNYSYSKNNSQAGFTLFSQSYGYNGGLTLSWNVFNGFNTRRLIKNANLNTNIAELQLKDFTNSVNAGLASAWANYTTTRQQYRLEQESNALAKENVDIMLERFRLGNCTTIDLKLAQQTLQDSQNRLILAGYQTKLAETELLRLNNGLVK